MSLETFKPLFDNQKFDDLLNKMEEFEKENKFELLDIDEKIEYLSYKVRTLVKRGKKDEALRIIENARQVYTTPKSKISLLTLISVHMSILWITGKIQEGLELSVEGDSICESLSEIEKQEGKLWLAEYTRVKGILKSIKGQLDEGIELFEQSLNLFDELGMEKDIAGLLNNLGILNAQKGRFKLAVDYLERSIKIKENLGDILDLCSTLNNICNCYYILGELDKAEEHCFKGLDLSKGQQDKILESSLMIQMGAITLGKGDYDRSYEYLTKSLEIRYEIGQDHETARTLYALAVLHTQRGEVEQALERFQETLDIREKLDNKREIAAVFNGLGLVYSIKGQWEKAIDYYKQTLKLYEEIKNPLNVSETLANICNSLIKLQQFDEKNEYYQKLKEFYEKNKGHKRIALLYKMTETFVLIETNEMDKLEQAEGMLDKIIAEDVLEYLQTITARLRKSQVIFKKYVLSGKKELLLHLEEEIETVLDLSKEKKQYTITLEMKVLKGKVDILLMKPESSRQLFTEAKTEAVTRGFNSIVEISEMELQKIANYQLYDEIESEQRKEAEFNEEGEIEQMIEYLNHIILTTQTIQISAK